MTKSYFDYVNVEKSVDKEVQKQAPGKFRFVKEVGLNSFKKNFFSIFMLSLINFADSNKPLNIIRGKIIFYLRGIITCTDNIIDRESKGVMFLDDIPEHNTNNVFLILVLQKCLIEDLDKLPCDFKIVLDSIYKIAKSESFRDRKIYDKYPSYDYISSNIHSGIGGELLKIGLVALSGIEKENLVNRLLDSLYSLGMALQALDDLCDMREDYDDEKINLATSFYMDSMKIDEKEAIGINIYNSELTKIYLKKVLDFAYNAFDILEDIGYPVTRKDGNKILEKLFELRGLKQLWSLVK